MQWFQHRNAIRKADAQKSHETNRIAFLYLAEDVIHRDQNEAEEERPNRDRMSVQQPCDQLR